jgi:hypothetical protein
MFVLYVKLSFLLELLHDFMKEFIFIKVLMIILGSVDFMYLTILLLDIFFEIMLSVMIRYIFQDYSKIRRQAYLITTFNHQFSFDILPIDHENS